MSNISNEEFNRLTPKEIRDYIGLYPVARIIKYIQEGRSQHKLEAIRTLSYWLKGCSIRGNLIEIKLFCYAFPFLIECFPYENKVTRSAIAAAIHYYVRTDATIGEDPAKKIKKLIKKEREEEIKTRLKQTLSWSKTFFRSFPEYHKLIITTTIEESLELIKDSEAYLAPLHFQPKQKRRPSRDGIQCVYFLQEKDRGYVKIGKTRNLKTKTFFPYLMPFEWEVIHTIESANIDSLEKYFHRLYRHKCINGEWFN